MRGLLRLLVIGLATAGVVVACGSSGLTEPVGPEQGGDRVDLGTLAPLFGPTVSVSVEGDEIVVRTNNVPDHPSPYFDAESPMYRSYDGPNTNFVLNPNRIEEQDFVYRIPRFPEAAAAVEATPLGPIGVAVNGVAFFNQYAGPDRPLTVEIDSFDQFNGHPQATGVYHYHKEPLYVTTDRGPDAFLGLLLDGFPVYGPVEGGKRLASADLDAQHGHFGATAQFPEGIYHYHVTDDDPYINGNGFHGTMGGIALGS